MTPIPPESDPLLSQEQLSAMFLAIGIREASRLEAENLHLRNLLAASSGAVEFFHRPIP